jgi:hypothetical protein
VGKSGRWIIPDHEYKRLVSLVVGKQSTPENVLPFVAKQPSPPPAGRSLEDEAKAIWGDMVHILGAGEAAALAAQVKDRHRKWSSLTDPEKEEYLKDLRESTAAAVAPEPGGAE